MNQPAPTASPMPDMAGRRYVFWSLFAVGALSYVDRQLLSVLAEPIRKELDFSDTQLGLLTGFSFALCYAIMAIPFAMVADRWHRIRLVAIACAAWSLFTALCGFAQTFTHLALARFGVGVGEAGGTAPSLSVLSDYYPPDRRSLMIGIFYVSSPVGIFLGGAFGGWGAQLIGWRGTFIAVGLLGAFVIAPLLLLAREPRRGQMDIDKTGIQRDSSSIAERSSELRTLFSRPSLRIAVISAALSTFVAYGLLNWVPAYLMRAHAMPLGALATWYAPAAGLSFGLGLWAGGAITAMALRKSVLAYALIPGVATAIFIPSLAAALLVDGWGAALALLFLPMVVSTAYFAPTMALVQNQASASVRTTAGAVTLLVLNLVGTGGGPLAVGMVSDALLPTYGVQSLRYALMALIPVSLIVIALLLLLARALKREAASLKISD